MDAQLNGPIEMSDIEFIQELSELESLYGAVSEGARRKVAPILTPLYSEWIAASKFCVMSTVGSVSTDVSPRGDKEPVVRIIDEKTLHMPDWRGNNRIDSLRNILQDGRISLMFMVSGVNDVVRVNGTAKITASKNLRKRFEHSGHKPTCVLIITVTEVQIHCPKSMMRSDLWNTNETLTVPTIGSILKEVTADDVGGVDFDKDLYERTKKTLWS